MRQIETTDETYCETPFLLKDGRILILYSKNPFPMGECPYQVFNAELMNQDDYAKRVDSFLKGL
jgi:hypothetical protein